MLRGQQTPGELNQRAARLHAFEGLDEVTATLERLAARDLVERQARRPGQKEDRYRHLLAGDGAEPAFPTVVPPHTFPQDPPHTAGGGWVPLTSVPTPSGLPAPEAPSEPAPPASDGPQGDGLTERVAALEAEVAELRGQLSELRASLGE
jgi:hypothetical protein